ncbi:hypothetical protein LJC20_00840 [Eubacteriales bacterium OttesenSCG-928-M02]|nr:hypothetical protein [Eubacteriales bacterium OttesenSCG-928-M02]
MRLTKKHMGYKVVAMMLAIIMLAMLVPQVSFAEGEANILFSLTFHSIDGSNVGGNISSVKTGEPFLVRLNYTLAQTTGVTEYQDIIITLFLPKGIKKENIDVFETNNDQVASAIYDSEDHAYIFSLKPSITPGSSRTLGLKVFYDNMTTANDLQESFGGYLTGNYIINAGVVGISPMSTGTKTIRTVAGDRWRIEKAVTEAKYTNENSELTPEGSGSNQYYDVTYLLDAYMVDEQGVRYPSPVDRYGRLDLEKFAIIDNLPQPKANTGDRNGYPAGGGGVIQKIEAGSGDISTRTLTPNQDYVVTKNSVDNSDKSVKITYYEKVENAASESRVPDGAPIPTKYWVTVRYPADKYEKPANIDLVKDILNNEATLDYKLVTETEPPDQKDDVDIYLGHKAGAKDPVDMVLVKRIKIGDFNEILTEKYQATPNGFGTVRFSLYMDEACNTPAKNAAGTQLVPTQTIDKDGKVTFSGIAPGTYYAREEQAPIGFSSQLNRVYKVSVDSTGKVTVGTAAPATEGVITNENTDSGVGILRFYKKGKPAGGTNLVVMPGVRFKLTNAQGTAAFSREVEADEYGLVDFLGVPPGNYVLEETFLPLEYSGEYTLSTQKINVTITANKINYLPGATSAATSVFENVSPKGKFTLFKYNSKKAAEGVAGAVLQLYGPFDSQAEANTAAGNIAGIPAAKKLDKITTKATEVYASGALDDGKWYLLHEETVPNGWSIPPGETGSHSSKDGKTIFQIEKNKTLEVKVANDPKIMVVFHKYFVLEYNKDNPAASTYRQALAGIEFNIYKYENGQKVGNPVNGDTPVVSGILSSGAPSSEGDAIIQLPAGTYIYEEVLSSATPYVPIAEHDRTFTVTGNETKNIIVEAYNRLPNQGQIAIIKKDWRTKAPIKGAKFNIYSGNTLMNPLGPIETDENGIAIGPMLPAGDYSIREVAWPEDSYVPHQGITEYKGYNASTKEAQKNAGAQGEGIPVVEDKQTPVIVYDDPLTRITIIKKNKKSDTVEVDMEDGATFKVYKSETDATNEDSPVGTGTIINGRLTLTKLEPGVTYYIRETVPTGFLFRWEDQDATQGITLVNEALAIFSVNAPTWEEPIEKTITIRNVRQAKVEVHKKAEWYDNNTTTYTDLSGAEFHIYPRISNDFVADESAAGAAKLKLDGTNHILSKGGLAPGDYWLEETTFPTGYGPGSGSNFVPSADGTRYAIPISLAPGDNMGVGYGTRIDTVNNAPLWGTFKIKKVDSLTPTKGLARTFDIYKASDLLTSIDTITTTAPTGAGTYAGRLEPGDYVLKEKYNDTDDADYEKNTASYPFTIEAGKTNTVHFDTPITNVPRGKIKIEKFALWKDKDGNVVIRRALPGSTFNIYASTGDYAADKNGPVLDTITVAMGTGADDGNAVGLSKPLDAGKYWVVETNSGSTDYDMPADELGKRYQEVTVENGHVAPVRADGVQKGYVSFDNTPKKSIIRLFKMEQGTTVPIPGAGFTLYKKVDGPGDGIIQATVPDGSNGYEQVYLQKVAGQDKMITNEFGIILTDVVLDIGVYYLYEEDDILNIGDPPKGPWLPTEPTRYTRVEVTVQNIGQVVSEYAYNYIPGEVGIRKVDDLYDENDTEAPIGVENAYVALFHDDGNTDQYVQDFLAKYDVYEVNNGKPKLDVADFSDTDWLMQNHIASIAKSTGPSGSLSFKNLDKNLTYWMMELVAPDGFVINESITHVKIAVDDKGTQDPSDDVWILARVSDSGSFDLVDIKYRRIRINKYGILSGHEVLLADAEFTVFAAEKDDDGTYVLGGENYKEGAEVGKMAYEGDGNYLSPALPPGIYIVRETKNPPGFTGTFKQIFDLRTITTDMERVALAPNSTSYKDLTWVDTKYTQNANRIRNQQEKGRFIFRKVSATNANEVLAATFVLEVETASPGVFVDYVPDGATEAYKFTTATGQTYYTSNYLPPGTYRLREISVATKNGVVYTQPTTATQYDGKTIKIEAGKITNATSPIGDQYQGQDDLKLLGNLANDNPILWKNMPTGHIRILKMGQKPNSYSGGSATTPIEVGLNGVQFGLYYDALCQDPVYTRKADGSFTTTHYTETTKNIDGVDGRLNFTNLDAGTVADGKEYYIKELSLGTHAADYDMAAMPIGPIKVYPAKTTTYAATGGSASLVQDTSLKVVNPSNKAMFLVEKVDKNDTATKVTGAKFDIYGSEANAKAGISKLGEMKELSNGIYISPLLDTGADGGAAKQYWLKETATNSNFHLPVGDDAIFGPYELTFAQRNTVVDIYLSGKPGAKLVENLKKLTITMVKEDSTNSATKIAGAQFTLYPTKADAENGTNILAVSKETGTDGKAIFYSDLTPGSEKQYFLKPGTEYWVVETKTPRGYVEDETPINVSTRTPADNPAGTPINDDAQLVFTKKNVPQGQILILKKAKWTEGSTTSYIPLPGITFKVLDKNKVDTGLRMTTAQVDSSVDLDIKKGMAKSGYLDPNDPSDVDDVYYLEEIPDANLGFSISNDAMNELVDGKYIKVKVAAGQTNNVWAKDGEYGQSGVKFIVNDAAKGDYTLLKAGYGTTTPLPAGTKFDLEMESSKGAGDWTHVETITIQNAVFTSGKMNPGSYRLTEVEAAPGYILDKTSMLFEIETGKTIALTKENKASGTIEILKTENGNARWNSEPAPAAPLPLQGATFKLYLQSDGTKTPVTVTVNGVTKTFEGTTNNGGKITWTDVPPGSYYVEETSSAPGYGKGAGDTWIYPVVVKDNQPTIITYGPDNSNVDEKLPVFTNTSNQGKILILKKDVDGNPINGAKFGIWKSNVDGDKLGDPDTPIMMVTITENGQALSGYLDADQAGTYYLVEEIEAPPGYTLDENLTEIRKKVLVLPFHVPVSGGADNVVSFKNYKESDLAGFAGDLKKEIAAADTTFVKAPKSLLLEEYNTTFRLRNYAKGENTRPITKFEVVDDTVRLFYQNDSLAKTEQARAETDYVINSVSVGKAYTKVSGEAVTATVYYKTFSDYSTPSADWREAEVIDNAENIGATWKEVDLSGLKAYVVKVVYEFAGKGEGFTAEGIDLDVTFNERVGGVDIYEIYRAENTFRTIYHYNRYDVAGNPTTPGEVESTSNVVAAEFPPVSDVFAVATITNRVNKDLDPDVPDEQKAGYGGLPYIYKKNGYYRNDSVPMNVDVRVTSDETLKKPVIVFDIPAYTKLLPEYNGTAPFLISNLTYDASGKPTVVGEYTGKAPTIYYETIDAVEYQEASGGGASGFVPVGNGVKTTRVYMVFDHEPNMLELGKDTGLRIDYAAVVDNNVPESVTATQTPAFLTSAYNIPKSKEAPHSISVRALVGGLDGLMSVQPISSYLANGTPNLEAIKGDLSVARYIFAEADIVILESYSLSILKEVKGEKDADFARSGRTYPAGTYEHRTTVNNNSENDIQKVRIVDILPFEGDTVEIRGGTNNTAQERQTTTPGRSTLLKKIDLDALKVMYPGVEIQIYYFIGAGANKGNPNAYWSKAAREAQTDPTIEDALVMMYYEYESNVPERKKLWNTDLWVKHEDLLDGDLVNVMAVGFDIVYPDDGLFVKGSEFQYTSEMKSPAFTPTNMDNYVGTQMVGSAMVSTAIKGRGFLPGGEVNPNTPATFGPEEMAGSHLVRVWVDMPLGEIGDYAWYDVDGDGVQGTDAKETPFAGVNVTLYQTVYNKDNPDGLTSVFVDTSGTGTPSKNPMVTDSDGKYLFFNVPCNYAKIGLDGSSNPPETDGIYDPANWGRTSNPNFWEYFINGECYSYYVEFDIPKTYDATKRYSTDNGGTIETDSNIESIPNGQYPDGVEKFLGRTGVFGMQVHFDGQELAGEKNHTMDAGFRQPVGIGDRVWYDVKNTGLQEMVDGKYTDGGGVNGVLVKLYKAEDDQGANPVFVTEMHTMNDPSTEDPSDPTNVPEKGYYFFPNLDPGYYIVEFDISGMYTDPDGYVSYAFTDANKGDDAFDSDAEFSMNQEDTIRRTKAITIAVGQTDKDVTWDAGLRIYSAISGYAFDDRNYNDMYDIGIPLLGTKVTLQVEDSTSPTGWKDVPGTTQEVDPVDASYSYKKLDAGTYRVRFDYPVEYEQVAYTTRTQGNYTQNSDVKDLFFENGLNGGYTTPIELGAGEHQPHWDGGARKYGAIGDYVWQDMNGDGLQDSDESGVPGIPVYLQVSKNGGNWEYVTETVTGPDGKYNFPRLESGTHSGNVYRVVFGFDPTTRITLTRVGGDSSIDSDAERYYVNALGAAGTMGYPTREIHLGYGETDPTWDAGITNQKLFIGDMIWIDLNKNGLQDDDEPGINGVQMRLLYYPNGDPSETPTVIGELTSGGWQSKVDADGVRRATKVNDIDGWYEFGDLDAGMYRMMFLLPDGYSFTTANVDNDNDPEVYLKDSDAFITYDAATGWYYSREFVINENSTNEFLWSWDAGLVYGSPGRTGDSADPWLWVSIMVLAGLAAGTTYFFHRRKRRKAN